MARHHGPQSLSIRKKENTMPVLLWLLGMPITLIIILMLVGVA
jgi:hypothetical protein